MGELFFDIKSLDHPYTSESGSNYEIWAKIALIYQEQTNRIVLFDWQWDLLTVCDWYLQCSDFLLSENFPFNENNIVSIAESRDLLYLKNNFKSEKEEEEYYSMLETYFHNHYFKLRGTDLPGYYLGVNNQEGEISRYDSIKEKYLSYQFNMEKFINTTRQEFKLVINDYLNINRNQKDKVFQRIKKMEKEYNKKLI